MSKKIVINRLTVVLGTVFTVSLANTVVANAADNPFGIKSLSGGYMMLAEGKCGEGKCGAGKGMARMDADGDGKVTKDEFIEGHKAMFDEIDQNGDGVIDQAERRAHMKNRKGCMQEGKCGEGKCGGSK
jgi:uncharacterized low-complexity protein